MENVVQQGTIPWLVNRIYISANLCFRYDEEGKPRKYFFYNPLQDLLAMQFADKKSASELKLKLEARGLIQSIFPRIITPYGDVFQAMIPQ